MDPITAIKVATPIISPMPAMAMMVSAYTYLKGQSLTVQVYNYTADYVTLDSYVSDNTKHSANAVIEKLAALKGEQHNSFLKFLE
ncbi:MAG: hypothetical protein HRK26_02370 [Rickettsiaceae bacterium H1]|nr:hypothetical protein [Rickettsiaceae bacterium H1]